jgi:Na+-driven multidrug efflux pump
MSSSSVSHEPSPSISRSIRFEPRDALATVSIVAIWLAVLFVGVFGPDFEGHSNDGNWSTIPSGIFVAFFAMFATMSVAKWGFKKPTNDG